MFEYSVVDFNAEVGFYTDVFGFPTIAMTRDYALFTDPGGAYCLSFRKANSSHLPGLKLLFMTTDIDSADTHLGNTGIVPDRKITKGSDVQRVIHFSSPSGLAIEIWEMPLEDG
jgi:predicted enzyme related to lactoylglutathione lyase